MSSPTDSDHRERLWPSWWVWLVVLIFGASFGLVVARISGEWALITALAATTVCAGLLARSTPTVGVAGTELVAGTARVPVGLTGQVDVLDAEAMRQAHGPRLDARAYLCLRGWIAPGVRIELIDPHDPTPYWLVSSRRPEKLAAAIAAAQKRTA